MPTYYAERVLHALRQDDTPVAIAAEADLASMGLALTVEGVGRSRLPPSEDFVAALLAASAPSPFGHRDQTLYDAQVRHAREIPADRITLSSGWAARLKRALQQLKQALGLPKDRAVQASLQKLVLYPEGGFFKAHRDTQRSPGMWGTLIVVLPTPHQGGALIVRHAGREQRFETAPGSAERRLSFLALYADCVHELLPVTHGTRLALTFALSGRVSAKPKAPPSAEGLAHALEHHFLEREQLVLLLDHVYTEQAFSWGSLRAQDGLRVARLRALAERFGLACFLAFAEVTEHYGMYLKGADGEDALDELQRCEVSLKGWIDGDGARCAGTLLPVPEGSVISAVEASERGHKHFSGEPWTGNEGGEATQWYRQAALILLHPSRTGLREISAPRRP